MTPRRLVATGHPRVSEAAAVALRAGGNAFDAAVAAGFAAAVAEPMFTSLGGGGFLLGRTSEGAKILFDFFVDSPGRGLPRSDLEPHFLPVTVHFPGSEQVFNVGLASAAVPGTLLGLLHVQGRLGELPLSEVVAPAVALARDGVVLTRHQAYSLELLRPINTLTEAGRSLYAPGGRPLAAGDRIRNPDLAAFLASLPADRGRDLYRGALARRIARDMREGQGLLTERDLASYQVVERQPLEVDYRVCRVLSNPPPSFGGSLVALSLALHATHGLGGERWGSGGHLRKLVAVMMEVDRLRAEGIVQQGALSADGLEAVARTVRATGGTTHISVSDARGNASSMTVSNGEGSGYVVPDTGIMLNNMLGEDDLHPEGFHAAQPGARVSSMMAPSILLEQGEVRLIVGSGGSKRIRTTLVQVMSDVVDFGMAVRDAVEAPRIHWDGECVQVEPGFDEGALSELRRSWPVNVWSERNLYFGGAQAVDPRGDAGGDPRRGGAALGLD